MENWTLQTWTEYTQSIEYIFNYEIPTWRKILFFIIAGINLVILNIKILFYKIIRK